MTPCLTFDRSYEAETEPRHTLRTQTQSDVRCDTYTHHTLQVPTTEIKENENENRGKVFYSATSRKACTMSHIMPI